MLLLRASSSVRPPICSSLKLSLPLLIPQFILPIKCTMLHYQATVSKSLLVPDSSRPSRSSCSKRLLSLLDSHHFFPRGIKASFHGGSDDGERWTCSRDGKEILIQHLLVKEDDFKLLLELQNRILTELIAHGRPVKIQHLLVKEDDFKLLLELQNRILTGEDLSDLAVEYSACPSKEEGGMLGWVRKGQMVPEFEEAAFNAPSNKVVKCKTKFGWHLLQVLSEREESILEEIQPLELHGKMQDPSFLEEAQLIDVREPEEVAKASVPYFKVLPLRQFGDWAPEISKKFDPQKDTYVMCHHGMRSLQFAKWLQTQGFRRVYNVSGGIHEYALKADLSVPTY